MEKEVIERLEEVFMPYASAAKRRIAKENKKFVHYTRAESAVKIIQTRLFWMRNVRCMVDYSEVTHGRDRIEQILSNEVHREPLRVALNKCHAGLYEDVINRYLSQRDFIASETFVASISEHENDEYHGRLSMWNSFGRGASTAAMVLNVSMEEADGDGIGVLFSPVAYFTDEEMLEEFKRVVENIGREAEFLSTLPYEVVARYMLFMIIMAATCLKHEGFKEEREWRAIHIPTVFDSPVIAKQIEYIDGVPQIVAKLPLRNFPELGVDDLDPDILIDHVIIGPTAYALPIRTALVVAMNGSEMKRSAERVTISGIPIRT